MPRSIPPEFGRIILRHRKVARPAEFVFSRHVEHKVAEIREREAQAKRAPAAEASGGSAALPHITFD